MFEHSRRSRKRQMSEINVVPYIDVMLVLLIIFMITAPMINPGQIELPQIGKSSMAPSPSFFMLVTRLTASTYQPNQCRLPSPFRHDLRA